MKLLITSKIPEEIYKKLEENFETSYHDSNMPLTKEVLIEKVPEFDAMLCPLSDKIDRDIIDEGKNLKIIANYGAGFDNIDIKFAAEKGIVVTNAPAPSSAISTAELAFTLILSFARNIVPADKEVRDGKFGGWRPTYFLGEQLKGKTLGIIGMGNIGKNLAKRAEAFEMKVIYSSRNRKTDVETENILYMEKDDVIKNVDFLSLNTAFSPELKHMIGEREFDMMKETAVFINTARGSLVDEQALVDALKNKKIAGAALDVYEKEPQVHPDLLAMDNVLLAPHIGNATTAARMEMGNAAAENLIAFKNGKSIPNKLN